MSFDKRIRDRLHHAEHQEITTSEEHFASDLRELLDDTAMTEGIHIELGDNPQALQRMLDLLDIEDSTGEAKFFNMVQGFVGSGTGLSFVPYKTVAPLIDTYGIPGTVELMQSDAWKTEGAVYKRIRTIDETVSSQVMLLHATERNENDATIDPASLAVLVGVSSRYQPASFDEHQEGEGLANLFERLEKSTDIRRRISKLGEALDYFESTLALPSKSYSIRLGKVFALDGTPYRGGPVDITPLHGYYELKDGRIVRDAERSHDHLE